MSSEDKKAERLASAAKKLAALTSKTGSTNGSSSQSAKKPVQSLPVFRSLEFDKKPDHVKLVEMYAELVELEHSTRETLLPATKQRLKEDEQRFSDIFDMVVNPINETCDTEPQSETQVAYRELVREITEGDDIMLNVLSFVKNTSLNFSPQTLKDEITTAIELSKSAVEFDNRQTKRGKGTEKGAKKKKADVESMVADRKHTRLAQHLKHQEDTLYDLLSVGRAYQLGQSGDVLTAEDTKTWEVVSTPKLRRLMFSRTYVCSALADVDKLKKQLDQDFPNQKQAIQVKLAQIAESNYKTISAKATNDQKLYLSFAYRVVTDTGHLMTKNPTPNMLEMYVHLKDDVKFDIWFKTLGNHLRLTGKTIVQQDKGKGSNSSTTTQNKEKSENEMPPKAKMPRVDYRPTGETSESNDKNTVSLMVNWGPAANARTTNFKLELKKGSSSSFDTVCEPEKAFAPVDFKYPGTYTLRVCAVNDDRLGEYSNEFKFELTTNGKIAGRDTASASESSSSKSTSKSQSDFDSKKKKASSSASERELRRAIDKATIKAQGTLHAKKRPQVIEELKSALLQHKNRVPEEMKAEAAELLVHLQRKDLTREWRQELKKWAEKLLDTETSDEEIELDIRVRMQSLNPEQLNWFYQHLLTRCTKTIDAYKGSFEKMPGAQMPTHRRLEVILALVLSNSNNMKAKLRDEIQNKKDSLGQALGKYDHLLEVKQKEEAEAKAVAQVVAQQRAKEEEEIKKQAAKKEEKRVQEKQQQERLRKEKDQRAEEQKRKQKEKEEQAKREQAEEQKRVAAQEQKQKAAEAQRQKDEEATAANAVSKQQGAVLKRAQQAKKRAEEGKANRDKNTQSQPSEKPDGSIPKAPAPTTAPMDGEWAASSLTALQKAKARMKNAKKNAEKKNKPALATLPPSPDRPDNSNKAAVPPTSNAVSSTQQYGSNGTSPPSTAAAPPPSTAPGPPPSTATGPPPSTATGPPPSTAAGPPPSTAAGPPPSTAAGPPPGMSPPTTIDESVLPPNPSILGAPPATSAATPSFDPWSSVSGAVGDDSADASNKTAPPGEFVPGVPFVPKGNMDSLNILLAPDAFGAPPTDNGQSGADADLPMPNFSVQDLLGESSQPESEDGKGNNQTATAKPPPGFEGLSSLDSQWPSAAETPSSTVGGADWGGLPSTTSGVWGAPGATEGLDSGVGGIGVGGGDNTSSDPWGPPGGIWAAPQATTELPSGDKPDDIGLNSLNMDFSMGLGGDEQPSAATTSGSSVGAPPGPPPGFSVFGAIGSIGGGGGSGTGSVDNNSAATSPSSTAPPVSLDTIQPEGGDQQDSDELDPKVKQFLTDCNMVKYADVFRDNEIDYESLLLMEQQDLKDIGIDKKGPLLKLTQAIRSANSNEQIALKRW